MTMEANSEKGLTGESTVGWANADEPTRFKDLNSEIQALIRDGEILRKAYEWVIQAGYWSTTEESSDCYQQVLDEIDRLRAEAGKDTKQ